MSQPLEDELVDFLVETCEAEESTTYLDKLLQQARAKIAGGAGSLGSLTNSSVNGKSFARLVHLSPLEVARACQRALRIHNDNQNEVSASYPDFRHINR